MKEPDKEKINACLISNFIQKHRRERTEFELRGDKKRFKFCNRLNHEYEKIFDMRRLCLLKKDQEYPQKISELLNLRDDEFCYVYSCSSALDDKIVSFKKALKEIFGLGMGTLLISLDGKKIYLETEYVQGGAERFFGIIKN